MSLSNAPLGHSVDYPAQYDPSLLFPIERAANRAALHLGADLPFHGADIWTAYELSWLNAKGKPLVAMAVFTIPADSPRLIESKSFKLYLNSFNQTRLDDESTLRERLTDDLSAAIGAPIGLQLILPRDFSHQAIAELNGHDLDALDVDIHTYEPAPELLRHAPNSRDDDVIEETLVSRLLKSNCPVTGQPDWASIQIRYRGRPLCHESVLRYIVSFRQHAGFHEHCVEQIHTDILRACAPADLTVYARYTRRGGLDINPWRSTVSSMSVGTLRTARQ